MHDLTSPKSIFSQLTLNVLILVSINLLQLGMFLLRIVIKKKKKIVTFCCTIKTKAKSNIASTCNKKCRKIYKKIQFYNKSTHKIIYETFLTFCCNFITFWTQSICERLVLNHYLHFAALIITLTRVLLHFNLLVITF